MDLRKYIDHTVLKAEATPQDIKKLCEEAKEYGFAAVCINPCYVKMAKELLLGTDVKVCTVIGFPLGANTSTLKAFEAKEAVENGADEVDMVINIGAVKNKDYTYVEKDIKMVVDSSKGACVKVIIECALLSEDEKTKVIEIVRDSGANYVKTSTGFSTGGATVGDVALMKKIVGDKIKIKAAGGIRTKETALEMIGAGANRIGASSSIKIVM